LTPTTRYARSGEASLAYQVAGEGELDLLILSGWLSHLEHGWDVAPARRFLEQLAEFARIISIDPRGSGLSDDLGVNYTLEQDAEDAIAVLDAVGCERVAIYGRWLGGALAVKLAADHPERVDALVLYAAAARTTWAPDYEWALTGEQRAAVVDAAMQDWGETYSREMARWGPALVEDPAVASWAAAHQRLLAAPGRARIRWEKTADIDVRELLPRVQAPTLVMHRTDEQVWDERHSRYLADHIPNARYLPLLGADSIDFVGDSEAVIDAIEEFLTGVRRSGVAARTLLTVMFTDIVDSTRRAAELGDRRWRDLLTEHDELVRHEISRFAGREVKTMGDGFLITFSGSPSSAVRCAEAISSAARELGVEVRIGLHTGECELSDGDVAGMAVNLASRVMAAAGPNEVLVSAAVSGAVVGGPFSFEDRGIHELKGVPGSWPLYALSTRSGPE
jgi:class 3 adenylate cyclase